LNLRTLTHEKGSRHSTLPGWANDATFEDIQRSFDPVDQTKVKRRFAASDYDPAMGTMIEEPLPTGEIPPHLLALPTQHGASNESSRLANLWQTIIQVPAFNTYTVIAVVSVVLVVAIVVNFPSRDMPETRPAVPVSESAPPINHNDTQTPPTTVRSIDSSTVPIVPVVPGSRKSLGPSN